MREDTSRLGQLLTTGSGGDRNLEVYPMAARRVAEAFLQVKKMEIRSVMSFRLKTRQSTTKFLK